jgi:ParB family transcriptional regulator, chromosome partitioning protein
MDWKPNPLRKKTVVRHEALGKNVSSILPRAQGLDSMLPRGDAKPEPDGPYREVAVSRVRPAAVQPRKFFDQEALEELAQSIQEKGILHPILVRQKGADYEIISGERRFRAAKKLELSTVPVLIRDVAEREQFEIALIENLQRTDLDVIEEARAYQDLVQRYSLTQDEIAKRVGRSRTSVTNSLRLLRLPERVQEALQAGVLSTGHAKVLLSQPIERQLMLLDSIRRESLSVRDLENKVKRMSRGLVMQRQKVRAGEGEQSQLPPVYQRLAAELKSSLGTQVSIDPGKKGHGKIMIDYYSYEQLDEIFQKLTS